MDLKAIKSIVNSNIPESAQRTMILTVIGRDETAISSVLTMVEETRKENKELLLDTNLELSRALVYVDNPKSIDRDFVKGEIHKHFLKWKDRIKCCFKFDGLP